MDKIDGEKVQRKTKTVRTKFVIPLCCFGANSQLDAEFNLTTNESTEESSDTPLTCGSCETQTKQGKEESTAAAPQAASNNGTEYGANTATVTNEKTSGELTGSI